MEVRDVHYKSFLHVERLDEKKIDVADFLDSDKIYCYVKMDGTNSCVWATNGEIHCGSRKREINAENDNANFYKYIVESDDPQIVALRKFCLDHEGLIVYGEFIGHVPETMKFVGSIKTYLTGGFFVFAVFDVDRGDYLSYPEYAPLFDGIYDKVLSPIAVLSHPKVEDIQALVDKNHYNLPEHEYGEGIVIYNYGYKDRFQRPVIAKIVRQEFLQGKGTKSKKNQAIIDGEIEREFVETYVTTADIAKVQAKIVVEQRAEEWDSTNKKFVGLLMNGVLVDLIDEELADFLRQKRYKVAINFNIVRNLVNQKVRDYLGF